jgi:small-conductance mechanosensitive channel
VVIARVVDFILARRDKAMAKLLGKTPDSADRTRYIMIRRLVFVGILFVGIGIALLKIPAVSTLARAMLASAAIIAGVIGIAARAPIANLVSGIMIAFSQPVRLNDYISVDGEFGTVEQISLIYTYIRSADGRRVVIPNEAFAMKAVHNYSMGSPGSMVTVDLALPLDADLERVAQAMLEVGEALAPAPVGKADSVEVADISGGGVRLRLHAWAADPLRRRELASDLRAALLRRLSGDGLIGGEEAAGDGD